MICSIPTLDLFLCVWVLWKECMVEILIVAYVVRPTEEYLSISFDNCSLDTCFLMDPLPTCQRPFNKGTISMVPTLRVGNALLSFCFFSSAAMVVKVVAAKVVVSVVGNRDGFDVWRSDWNVRDAKALNM